MKPFAKIERFLMFSILPKETFFYLKSAAFNTDCGIDEWIEVIGKLIAHVGAFSPKQFGTDNFQSAGWLISELSACNREIKQAVHILDNASIKTGNT
jgi:hypothetical protein